MKKIAISIIILILNFAFFGITKAEEENIEINYQKNISIGEKFSVDLKDIKGELEKKYNSEIFFEWNVKGTATKSGEVFERKFENFGEKEIGISIFKDEKGEKKMIFNKELNIFVFSKSIPFIFETGIKKEELNNFIESSKNSGIYIYNLKTLSEKNINKEKIIDNLFYYKNTKGIKSDYIGIWGEKDFVLSIVSKINKEFEESKLKDSLNLVLISSFNIDILKNYLSNFLLNKDWAKNIILIDETSKFQVLSQTEKIENLEKEIIKNNYRYIKIDKKQNINNWFFIGNFINLLSQKGFSTSEIYLIIIIPFLLTIISIMKQFIGLSPIGIILPLSITFLLFRVGIISGSLFLLSIVLLNLALSRITNRYNLLYVPKITFILIINIILFIFIITWLYKYNMLTANENDLIFIFIMLIISERLINMLLSKEIFENIGGFGNTLVFSFFSYFLFNLNIVKIMLLSYPEIIIALIPLNFMIGKFSGLRITEYFRFREIIKSVEE